MSGWTEMQRREATRDVAESYREMARHSVETHRSKWWLKASGYGEKTARKMLRADLEVCRYARQMAACNGNMEKEHDLLRNFKWKWNK